MEAMGIATAAPRTRCLSRSDCRRGVPSFPAVLGSSCLENPFTRIDGVCLIEPAAAIDDRIVHRGVSASCSRRARLARLVSCEAPSRRTIGAGRCAACISSARRVRRRSWSLRQRFLYDFVADVRPDSPTFGRWEAFD